MPHRQPLTHWSFNERRQELRSPGGVVISIQEIAQLLADQRECRHDFAGEWQGWKMRRQFLIPPFTGKNGPKLTPENAKRFAEWVDEPTAKDQARRSTKPRLYIVR